MSWLLRNNGTPAANHEKPRNVGSDIMAATVKDLWIML
jgi:hypothetical protein